MLLRRYGCVRERRWRIVLTDALRKCSIPPFWMVFSKTFSELVRGVGKRDNASNDFWQNWLWKSHQILSVGQEI